VSPGAYLAGAALTAALCGWLAWRGDLFALVIATPVFAYFGGRLLVVGGFDGLEWLKRRHKGEWNGLYYEFGPVHLRAVETEVGLVFVEDDLLAVIEQPGSRTPRLFGPAERVRVEGTKWHALTEAGVERLLLKCPHRDAKSLLLYLRRSAFLPYARRHDRQRPGSA
jgi:hypothetical protein